jgi:hypothetical protein
VFVGSAPKRSQPKPQPAAADVGAVPNAAFEGTWNLTVKGPTGPQPTVLVIERATDGFSGTQSGQGMASPVSEVTVTDNKVSWINHVTKPIKVKTLFTGEISGNHMSGKVKVGFIGSYPFTAVKQ